MRPPQPQVDDLSLTAPHLDDADDWAAAQDDECARWFDWPCRPPVERCRDHLRKVTADRDPNAYTWAIRTPAGFAGGIDLTLDEERWNVSYFVHPDHRGRHIARRALHAVTDWAFTDLGLEVISTRVHVDNSASHTDLEAAGFSRVGTEDNPDADHRDHIYERRR